MSRLLEAAERVRVLVEPRGCEYCGYEHDACDICGHATTLRTCPSCGHLTCEIEAMYVGDARERAGLSRLAVEGQDGGRVATPAESPFVREARIKTAAVRHAMAVHEDPASPPLTPFGTACCAAAAAVVLTDESHPNHAQFAARYLAAAGQEDRDA